MKSGKILEHTADIRLQVEGESLPELFTAALEGMAEIIKPGIIEKNQGQQDQSQTKTLNISSANSTLLLIDFLSEVLTLTQIHQTIFYTVEFNGFTEISLRAKIFGTKVENFDEDIKAVTYHEAAIKKNKKGNFETIIIFDI